MAIFRAKNFPCAGSFGYGVEDLYARARKNIWGIDVGEAGRPVRGGALPEAGAAGVFTQEGAGAAVGSGGRDARANRWPVALCQLYHGSLTTTGSSPPRGRGARRSRQTTWKVAWLGGRWARFVAMRRLLRRPLQGPRPAAAAGGSQPRLPFGLKVAEFQRRRAGGSAGLPDWGETFPAQRGGIARAPAGSRLICARSASP